MNPRRVLAGVGLAVVAVVLAGCPRGGGPGTEGGAAKEPWETGPAGVLRMSVGTMPKGIDYHVVTGIPEAKVIGALMEGLVDYHPTQEAVVAPGVAERWEVSEDGLVYTFHLRADARWSNGDPVVAEDFRAAFRRVLDPDMASLYREMLFSMRNAEAYAEGKLKDFDEVGCRVVGDRVLEITLGGPTPYFLEQLCHYTWFPVHRPTLDRFEAWKRRDTPWTRVGNFVGNGAFVLKEWKDSQIIVAERSPTYWDKATVGLDRIEFYTVENTDSEDRMFRAGQLDITDSVPFTRRNEYRRTAFPAFRQDAQLGVSYLVMNCQRPALANAPLRRALSLAIEREVIPANVTFSGVPATRFTPAALPGHDPKVSVGYDPARARAELEAAGYPGGRGAPTLTLTITNSDTTLKMAEVLQNMWKRDLGVDVQIHNMEWRVMLSKVVSGGDFDLALLAWIGDYTYPDTFLKLFMTGNGNNRSGWSDPAFDALMRESLTLSDLARRRTLLEQAEERMLAEAPVAPILWSSYNKLVSPRIEGWNPKLQDLRPYKHVRAR